MLVLATLGSLLSLCLTAPIPAARATTSGDHPAYGKEAVWRHAISSHGKWAVGARRSNRVELYDAELQVVCELQSRKAPGLVELAFSPDERRLAAADREGRLLIWDLETLKGKAIGDPIVITDLELRDEEDERRTAALSWSPDSSRLLVQRRGGPRALYGTDGALVKRFDAVGHPGGDIDAVWRASTHALLLRQKLGVAAYDWRTGTMNEEEGQAVFYSVGETPWAYGLSPDGMELVVSSSPMVMTFFDAATGEATRSWKFTNDFAINDDNQYCQLRYSPDGSRLAFSSIETMYYGVLDVSTLEPIYQTGWCGGHFRNVHYMRWLPGSNDTLSVYYECCPWGPQLLLLEPEPRWQDTQELWIPRFSDRGGIALKDGELAIWSPEPPAEEETKAETEVEGDVPEEGR